jgi:hypothetical protein
MLAMLLVTWAASFGINEFGVEEDAERPSSDTSSSPEFSPDCDDEFSDPKRRAKTLRTEAMAREILALVDNHGILRRPSWDGVRVLLLLLPLTKGQYSSFDTEIDYSFCNRNTKLHRTPG